MCVCARFPPEVCYSWPSQCWAGCHPTWLYTAPGSERKEIVVRFENGEPLELTTEGHTNPQQQELGLNEIQQEPSIWRFQPISDGPGGQKQEEKRRC